jgi:chromosome segregation ATPase
VFLLLLSFLHLQEVSKLRAALSRATGAATDKEAALGEARAQLSRLGGQLEAAQGEAAALRRQLDSERCDHQVGGGGWLWS